MADVIAIKATARPRNGKGAVRAVRREGKVPGVIYGDKQEPQTIALDYAELAKLISRGRFLSTVFDVEIGGKKNRVLPRDVQVDPVKDLPIHVDFQRVGVSSRIRVAIPVRFINEGLSPGLKRGGVLNIVRHEVEVTCPADQIPTHFEVNLEGLDIGRSIHISAMKLPDGVKPTILNRDFTVATIAGKKAEEEVKPAEGAAVAPAAGDAAAAAPGDAKAAPAAPAAGGAPAAGAKGAPAAGGAKGGGDKKK